MDLKLTGKNVLVTGGAAGIGAGICKVFAAEGANVVVNYRSRQAEAEAFARELRESCGVDAIAIQADITDPVAAKRLFTQTTAHFGALDVLVNNAVGGVSFKPFQEYTEEDWRLAQAGICDHVFRMSQLFLRACLEAGREGRIINVLSKSAILSSSIHNLTYVTNKGALLALTRGMAKEFVSQGVYVNGIVPGYVRTRAHAQGEERTERVKQLLPLRRFAEPEEIGNVAAILASPLFAQMVGSIVDCTGGTLI